VNRPATALAVSCLLTTASCNLVAGLDQFHPASGSGGAGSATTSGDTTTTVTGTSSTKSATSSSKTTTTTTSTGSGNCANHVLINEVDLQDDWVELYNPTASDIDVTSYTLWAHGGSTTTLVKKWFGPPPSSIPAHGYVWLGAPSGADGSFMSIISKMTDPAVIVLRDGATDVDNVCVCSTSQCNIDSATAMYCGQPIVNSAFFNATTVVSVGRSSCVDTGDNTVDFAQDCPTPKAANQACP